MNRIWLGIALGFVVVSSGFSNDTVAEIGAGGLQYITTGDIEMVREDLYVSADFIRVDYVFRNTTELDIVKLVAFPMPDITPDPYSDIGLPRQSDNFLGFSVSVEGKEIEPALQQRASIVGVDITSELRKRFVPLFPEDSETLQALENLSAQHQLELEQLGAVIIEVYNSGQGIEDHPQPAWTLSSAYYWEMTFPAGKDIAVSHTYTPAVGATTGLSPSFYSDAPISADYANRYCVDDGFVRAVKRRIDEGTMFFESWISYILTTGRNWQGAIGSFNLTVDKGATSNLVSFCGEGVTKTGPTTFELSIENYYPEGELDILILVGMEN